MISTATHLFPHRYVKTPGGLSRLGDFLSPYGKDVFILFDALILKRYGDSVLKSLETGGTHVRVDTLRKECCEIEGETFLEKLKGSLPDCVIGIGGGKAIDLAKWIAKNIKKPFISFPTSAATCAATTSISVLYTPEGHYQETVMTTPPVLTLVDPEILLSQPPRLFAAGMADAIAKWIGARGMRKQHHKHILSASALSLARLTYEFLTKRGTRALEDLKKGNWTQTLSEITDINLFVTGLISALDGKSVRVSAAHAFQNAFCGLGTQKDILHGEWVAFGVIFQMVLEGVSPTLIKRHIILFRRWGLPLTLGSLGIGKDTSLLETGIKTMMKKKSPLHNLLMPVRAEQVRAAILEADRFSRE